MGPTNSLACIIKNFNFDESVQSSKPTLEGNEPFNLLPKKYANSKFLVLSTFGCIDVTLVLETEYCNNFEFCKSVGAGIVPLT